MNGSCGGGNILINVNLSSCLYLSSHLAILYYQEPRYYFNFFFLKIQEHPVFFTFTFLQQVSLSLNFIFSCTHCPTSNSLASCGECFCNITGSLMNFVVVVVIYLAKPNNYLSHLKSMAYDFKQLQTLVA